MKEEFDFSNYGRGDVLVVEAELSSGASLVGAYRVDHVHVGMTGSDPTALDASSEQSTIRLHPDGRVTNPARDDKEVGEIEQIKRLDT